MICRLLHHFHKGREERLSALIRTAKIAGRGDPQHLDDLLGYVQTNLHGSRAVEKRIELVIGRRFKGRGMRWTRTGANRSVTLP